MLAPDTRELLLDLLRPPDGWQLDQAIGTTFTLDLQALLVAPLSFAMFDWAFEEDGRLDPIAALEALRRYAARTTVFCQAGMIHLPSKYQPLLVHLERSVVPVTPPSWDAIFHPKVWLLRFTSPDYEEPWFRLVNASRNLTFDASWDTVVALEQDRRMRRTPSAPVARFVRGLAELAGNSIDDDRRRMLDELAEQVAHIRFEAPEGFDELRFHPLGLDGPSWPFPEERDRTVVVSPFLGASTAQRLRSDGRTDVLVSRPESLDGCGGDGLAGYDTKVLASDQLDDETLLADRLEADATPADAGAVPGLAATTLRGLHAKLFLFDRGDRAHLFTGSANATAAAFGGNVEFLVELVGPRTEVGTAALLDSPRGVRGFDQLLIDHPLAPEPEAEDDEAGRSLAADLEHAQRALGRLTYTATATETDGNYRFELRGDGQLELPTSVESARCWRITAGQGHQVTPSTSSRGLTADFGIVPEDGLTSFIAFEVVGQVEGRRESVRFVANTRLEGGPSDRAERVLSRLLRDRRDLLRYLQFLLADTTGGLHALIEDLSDGAGSGAAAGSLLDHPALLEQLLTSLVQDRARLSHVDRLLDDLERTGRTTELLPDGLTEIWAVIDEVRRELEGSTASGVGA